MMIITGAKQEGSWHIGEDMNIPHGRVITFQVDRDELDWLLDAIEDELKRDGYKMNFPAAQVTPIL